ncbi:MAG: T9SS type A sorting domain-containing protein [Bacteroidia bacterium]
MKFKTTFLSLLAFSAFTISYISSTRLHKNKEEKEKTESGPGMEDDALERMKWELMRFADPATGKIPENIREQELAFAATLPSDANAQNSKMMTLSLTSRGPWNVGGKTGAFGIDVNNENRLLAGTHSGSMWLSTDGGASWTATNTPAQLKGANCLTQDKRPTHSNVWYYGGGNPWASAGGGGNAYYLGDGLYKSIDSGLTWQPIASTAGGNPNSFTGGWQMVYSIANDNSAPDSTSEIYAAVMGSIQRSVNGGTTWTTALSGSSAYFTEVACTSTGVVYATLDDNGGAKKGIWRSPDGITWTSILPPGFPTAYNRIVMGINPNDENEIYFLGNTPGFGKEVIDFLGTAHWNSLWKYNYVSGDGSGAGGTWQDLSINLPATGGVFDKFHTQDSYDMVVRVKPGSSNVVFVGGTNLYRSTTGFQDSINTSFIGGYVQGATLPVVNSYLNHHPDQHTLEFLPSDPNKMISTNDGGVFKCSDNTAATVAWQPLNNGYLTSMFYTVAIDHGPANNDVICGGAQDNGTWFTNTSSPTASWLHVHGGDGSYCAIADNLTNYYFSLQNGMHIVKATLDAAGNQTGFRRMDPIGGKGYLWMNPFILDPNNNNIMYLAGGKYLWRNDDLSAIATTPTGAWDSISTNWVKYIDSVPTANAVITALAVSKTPANRVYYGTSSRKVYRVDNANVGTPTPVDITQVSGANAFPGSGYVSNIAVDPTDGNKLMVIFSNYNVYSIYYSQDGGTTWNKAGGNLETTSVASPSIRWASILPVSDGKVYLLATSVGFFATDSLNGTSTNWVLQGASTIGNSVCDMIESRPSDGLVVIATHSSGMYSTHITSVNDILTVHDIAAAKADLQLINYPNPVSSSTTIEFVLNKRGPVNLQVLDQYGRSVETLVNENMAEGKHDIVFDKKNLASGIYYYSLIADNKRKTNKMVIVK